MKTALMHTPVMQPERTSHQTFEWAVRLAVEADQAGFSEMLVAEHATQAWECIPNPELVIAAAALQTEQITFAPMAHLLPYHNPASLAIQTGWMSRILKGRYFLGIGAGAYPSDGLLRGLTDLSENHLMVREAMEIMERIWKREPFTYAGKYFRAGFPEEHEGDSDDDFHRLADHSPYEGKMEIAVAGLSLKSPSMRFAGENNYIPVSIFCGQETMRSHWETYEEAGIANGHAPDRSRYHVSQDVFVAETDAEAKRRSMEGPMGFCWERYLLPVYTQFGNIQGFIDDAGGLDRSEVDLEWIADNVWIVGSPETVVEKIQARYDRVGGWGTMLVPSYDYSDDPAPWIESMNLITKEVAPKIRTVAAASTDA
jgi:alkanesulfonate monooxygenase SsuD/methylene tetrahydromethanopterin reductase-like flavin-dependent oxidoreductase (luciferase family)